MILEENFLLSNKVQMPKLGLGTWRITDKKECIKIVKYAIDEVKIRAIDTADFYNNHKFIGKALKECKTEREKIFLTTKLWDNTKKLTKEKAIKTVNRFLKELKTDYIDLLLIHWPVANSLIMWEAFEELYKLKIVRAIGVSNFTVKQLEDFNSKVSIKPMVNQIQLHLNLQRKDIVEYCQNNNILITSWQTIDEGKLLKEPIVMELAKKYNVSEARLCFRWALQNNISIIPKSTKFERILDNAKLDFDISKEDMTNLNNIKSNFECKKLTKAKTSSEYVHDHITW